MNRESPEDLGQGLPRLARQLSTGARPILCQYAEILPHLKCPEYMEDGDYIMIWGQIEDIVLSGQKGHLRPFGPTPHQTGLPETWGPTSADPLCEGGSLTNWRPPFALSQAPGPLLDLAPHLCLRVSSMVLASLGGYSPVAVWEKQPPPWVAPGTQR